MIFSIFNSIQRIWPNGSSVILMTLTGLLFLGSCGESSTADSEATPESSTLQSAAENPEARLPLANVATDFADRVVIPTYENLVRQSQRLVGAVAAFTSDPHLATLQTARSAWLEARIPWEQSEAFAFGPAASLGYDGDLDDWPVNETDVNAVLHSHDELTVDYVKTLQTTQKGFHTIELLLFGTNNDKAVTDFSDRDLQLLRVLAQAFEQTAHELLQSWQVGIAGESPYREVLATAGDSNNPAYPTENAAVEEIAQGIIGCLDEVAKEKIGDPLKSQDTEGLESRFSQSSLNDFKNNLRSVEIAYLGQTSAADRAAKNRLSALVAQADPATDKQIKQEIASALSAIEAIPVPIETQLANQATAEKLASAKAVIEALQATFEGKVLPIVQG